MNGAAHAGRIRVTFVAKLERKHPKLPVYVVVPAAKAKVLELCATAIIEGAINGCPFGRRSIKRWDTAPQSPWFIEFTTPFCKQAGLLVGDRLRVTFWLASSALPTELEVALRQSPGLWASWIALSDYTRRTSAEHVHAAKSPATRLRRAAAIVAKISPAGAGN